MTKARLILLPLLFLGACWICAGCSDDDKGTGPTPAVYHAVSYCETGGFNFASHTSDFVPVYSLPCYSGATLGDSIVKFTGRTIEVMFVGGDNQFSAATADSIAAATSRRKILVINFWSNRNFDACLPATNAGNAAYGAYLQVVDSTNPIFAGLPSRFARTGDNYNREHAVAKVGATVLMRYDNGDPALLYWKYGDGYVIQWTLELMNVFDFQGGALDLITYRTIKHCLTLQGR